MYRWRHLASTRSTLDSSESFRSANKPPRSSKVEQGRTSSALHRDRFGNRRRLPRGFPESLASRRREHSCTRAIPPAAEFVTLLPSQIVQGQHESSLLSPHFHPSGFRGRRFMGPIQRKRHTSPNGTSGQLCPRNRDCNSRAARRRGVNQGQST